MTLSALMSEIERCLPDGGDWCDLEKAQTLAAMIVGIRPRVVCEIGVWMGGSFVPMALALRAIVDLDRERGRSHVARRAIAIDPWAPDESCAGQDPVNASWWGSADHDRAMATFIDRIDRHGVRDLCEIVRKSSQDAAVPDSIDVLHVDGNHADQARRDVERFAPSVSRGGVLVLDDLSWSGGHVRRAREIARELGFVDMYHLGTGIVMRRQSGT